MSVGVGLEAVRGILTHDGERWACRCTTTHVIVGAEIVRTVVFVTHAIGNELCVNCGCERPGLAVVDEVREAMADAHRRGDALPSVSIRGAR